MRLKRLISAFIVCAMLVTFMPMQAFAVDDVVEEQSEAMQLNEELVESDELESTAPDILKTHIEDESIVLGESEELSGTWSKGTDHKWKSSDETSVSVQQGGTFSPHTATITAHSVSGNPVTITHYYKFFGAEDWNSESWKVTVTLPNAKFFVLKAIGNEPSSGEDQGSDKYYPNDKDTITVGGETYNKGSGLPGSLTEKGYELLQDNDGEYFALGEEIPIDKELVIEPGQEYMDALRKVADLSDEQEIIWYVMKDQEDGYHVDGYVSNIPVTVTYETGYPEASGIEDKTFEDTDAFTGSYELLSPEACGFSLSGYTFTGWKLKGSDTGKTYEPNTSFELTKAETFVAQWEKDEEPVGSTNGYFYVLKPGSQDDPTTTDPQSFYYVGKGKIQKDPMAQTSFEGDGVADQIVKVPSTWPDGVPENIKTATGTDFSDVLWYRVSQDNGANDNNSNPTDDPVPGSELAWHVDGILRPEDGEYTALFLWQDSDDLKFVYRADITAGTKIDSKVVKDADEAALKAAGKTSDEWHVVWSKDGKQVDVAEETGTNGEILVFYADFTELAPDLSIEKALTQVNGKPYNDGQSVQSGDVLTYEITVKNDGNKDATLESGSFNVTDSMWSGNGLLDSVEFTNANGVTSVSPVEEYKIEGGTVHVIAIPAHSWYVFTYHYTVQMDDEGKTLSNTVKLTSSDVDINDSVNVEVEKTHCTITYEYQSGTAGKQLPTDLLPAVPEAQVFHIGDLMNEVPVPGKTTIETEDGTWQFMGWYSEGILLNLPVRIDKDMHVIGLWNFYEYNTHDVKVQYVLEDGADEVTLEKATLPAKHNTSWAVSVSDTGNLVDVSNLTVARTVENNGKHYAFKEFQNEQLDGKVTENITITAVYGLDEIGGGSDQKQPDGVPDEYQATVTYRVVNGTWSDGTELDRTEVFDLYSFDDVAAKWVQIPNVTLGNTIPTGMLADANYVGQRGAWNEDITSETAVTGDATYIYRFGDAAADKIVVYYEDDGSGYGTVSPKQQVFTEEDWEPITGTEKYVMIHLTATAEDDGGRTYFDEWWGSLVDDLDRDITEDEDLNVRVEAEIGQTYTIIANFDRDSGGGAQHPDAGDDDDNDRDDDTEEIIDEEVPLAETPWLNTEDHYAYVVGYSEDGTVRPNANITRAEVATIFFRLLTDNARDQFWMTSNNFSDVLPNDWYNTAVSTMVNMGIIQGYEDGTFRPNANITRAEFATIAARFLASGYEVEDDLFTDIANHWARESINDAAMAGWINGYEDGTFRPDAAITRAEAVTMVNNVLQRKPDADHMLDSMIKWPDNPEGTWYYEAIQEATNSHDYDLFEDAEYETWTALQENRDWAALEKDWANAHVS